VDRPRDPERNSDGRRERDSGAHRDSRGERDGERVREGEREGRGEGVREAAGVKVHHDSASAQGRDLTYGLNTALGRKEEDRQAPFTIQPFDLVQIHEQG